MTSALQQGLPLGEPVVELTGIRKVFRQVLAPNQGPGMLARLFRRGAKADAVKGVPQAAQAEGGSHGGGNGAGDHGVDGGVEVLSGIDLTIRAGEFVALQGTSGSGKSTLLHLMGLLDSPTSGAYRLLGRDVSGLPDDELSRLRNTVLGFVFQSFYLVPYATALENVMLPGMYSDLSQAELRSRGLELLGRVGLADRVNFKPANLSGGQQQRVAMARALLNKPRLILADEPTGQLDSATSAEIMRLFAQVNQTGTSIVLVTHDEAVAAQAGRIIKIADGRLVSDTSSGAASPAV
ncbi:MAG: ABC transporter ATP-binding protein [Humidesulfovibrio sp.]|jgi:putative ABC transport system ATP-binding protein|uniref:ABC transporter ATP-binding protein n=1 Tax=Humidesulfovibrio sp. TaxID=2910988 RepID=UPI0027350A8C|nr:ABC transporter ATP-binding protein [Humidesulfovibrio sp.]MDP2847670.1 ABC transporter ATP-binding protein [Humidesulfovibrio sp.]